MHILSAAAVKPRLTEGREIAFLDVREAGQYGEGHPFFAVNVPYSRLELEVVALVPRKATPVVLLDDGDGVAEKAARRLAALGYRDISILDGGAPGWAKAGYMLFKGVNLLIARNHPVRQLDVALGNGINGIGKLLFRKASHLRQQLLEAGEIVIVGFNCVVRH